MTSYEKNEELGAEWVRRNPTFYNCWENIEALLNVMKEFDLTISDNNLDRAFEILHGRKVLIEQSA